VMFGSNIGEAHHFRGKSHFCGGTPHLVRKILTEFFTNVAPKKQQLALLSGFGPRLFSRYTSVIFLKILPRNPYLFDFFFVFCCPHPGIHARA
jgi:hypothetical protein